MNKIWRKPVASRDKLIARWGKDDDGDTGIVYANGPGTHHSDAHILYFALEINDQGWGRNLLHELEERGYDLTTLKFSIQKKK